MVIGQGDVSGGDDFAREPPPVQRVDRSHRRRHARTLDVNVALKKERQRKVVRRKISNTCQCQDLSQGH